jgi:voltage-gated potassium channel
VGEAGNEDMLTRAGIENAKGVIAVTATDAENVFLILIAKQLNPKVFVVARASKDSSKKTLHAAGADKVISPYDIGARRMAHAILRPTVIKFLETAFSDDETDIQIEEILVKPESRLAGVHLIDSGIRKNLNLIILAIKTKQDNMIFNPKAGTKIEPGNTMVAVGSAKSLVQLELMLHG